MDSHAQVIRVENSGISETEWVDARKAENIRFPVAYAVVSTEVAALEAPKSSPMERNRPVRKRERKVVG